MRTHTHIHRTFVLRNISCAVHIHYMFFTPFARSFAFLLRCTCNIRDTLFTAAISCSIIVPHLRVISNRFHLIAVINTWNVYRNYCLLNVCLAPSKSNTPEHIARVLARTIQSLNCLIHFRSSTNRQSNFGDALRFHCNNQCFLLFKEKRWVYTQNHSELNGINIINFIVIYEFNDIAIYFFLLVFHLPSANHFIVGMGRARILIAQFFWGVFSLSATLVEHFKGENNATESISYFTYFDMYYLCKATPKIQHGNKANELTITFSARFIIFTFPIRA